MLKKFQNLLPLFLLSSALSFAQRNIAQPKNLHLYILAGQSNMAGRGELPTEQNLPPHPRVYMLDKDNHWQLAKNPVHFDKPGITGVGPGLSFGIEMAKEDTSIRIGLIPCAVGGTSIEKWAMGAFDPVTKTHPYDDAVSRIREAMKFGTIKGMLWHQGESNAKDKDLHNYLDNFENLIGRIRKLVMNMNLPVVIGELGQFREPFRMFNLDILRHIEGRISNSGLVTSEGLTHKGDSTHFNRESSYQLGIRFAAKMKELQSIPAKKRQ